MPVDVTKLLTPADHRLVARAKKRGEKAAQKVMQAIARSAGQTAFELRSPPSLPTRSIAFSRLSLTAAIEQVSRALLAARWHEMDGEEASTIFGQGGRGARECP